MEGFLLILSHVSQQRLNTGNPWYNSPTMKKQGSWVECTGCEKYFWVSDITEEKAKQLSKQVVLCPACRKRAEEDTEEDQ